MNYISTIVNNKNEINEELKTEDLDIILSSGNGSKNKIFSALGIVNTKFDPKTYSKKNIEKFEELKDLIDPLEEEGINPNEEFEEIAFEFVPKLQNGLKFNLDSFDFKVYKEDDDIKTFDKSIFDNNNDNKNILCVYSTKLDGKRHKLKKIITLIETILDCKEKFFKIFKRALFIFEVKNIDQIEEEYLKNIPYELQEINKEEEYYQGIQILFNIKKDDDDNKASDIFHNKDFAKNFYFILNKYNYIIKTKSLYYPEDVVKNAFEEEEKNPKDKEEEDIDKKIEGFYEFYEFLKNIKEVKYYFYFSYHFNLILKYNEIEEKLIIKDIHFTRFDGSFKPTEYKKLKQLISVFKPDYEDLKEIETVDIDIDFNDMKCIKCSRKIKDDEELFYCYICKDKYCFDCVKSHLQNNVGKKKFIDPQHNLVFFKTRDKNKLCGIEKYKLGKNTFATADEKDLGRFTRVQCDGCGAQFATSARYICVSCKPGLAGQDGYKDYCQNCIENMKQNNKKGQDMQSYRDTVYNRNICFLRDEKCYMYHNHKDHVYLMVPLGNNNEENPYTDY
jgi:hypothetical protein